MSFCFTIAELEFVRNPALEAGKKPRTQAQQTRSPRLRWVKSCLGSACGKGLAQKPLAAADQSRRFTLSKLHNPKNTRLIDPWKRVLELSAYAASPCWPFIVAKCALLHLKRLCPSPTFQALHAEAPCTSPPHKPQLRCSKVCYRSRYL